MITEDYVSFETVKLLKERGFDEKCNMAYFNGTLVDYTMFGFCLGGNLLYCPTLQMAMKWLREVHSLVIEPYRTACGYLYTISNIPYGSNLYDNAQEFNGDDEDSGQWSSWEKACENGIKYCLEKLI